MSATELKRAGVLARVAAATLTLGAAAELMGVSYRQAKRLSARFRQKGAAGLRHGNAGRASNRATAASVRKRVLKLVREKYGGAIDERFGPTLAAEHLASEDGVTVDHETLRRWLLAAGLWSRARKRSPHRRRRERKAHFGELVQMDGSFHRWFEARAPMSCLLTLVDDATGTTFGRFGTQETIWAAVDVLRAWIERYGIPQALYTDWKNVYVRPPNQTERVTGAEPLTQFGRMCATLGIQIIPASSPQAKGRIERNHGTQQDRLVKKLRRKGIADIACANAFVEGEYWAEHNARFARPPGSSDDYHVARPRGLQLDTVFRLQDVRTVSNDWVVRYHTRSFQLERQSGQAPARSTVVVHEDAAGRLEIRYRDRVVRWTEIIASALGPLPVPPAPVARPGAPSVPRRPHAPANHPWRQGFKHMGRDVPYWQLIDR
jgi:transposase